MGRTANPFSSLLRGAAFLVTALAIIGAPARRLPAQVKETAETTGSLYGTVRSAEFRPLSAATVEIPELGRIAVTNHQGEFYLRDLPLGALDLSLPHASSVRRRYARKLVSLCNSQRHHER